MAPVELPEDIFEVEGRYYQYLGNGTQARLVKESELEDIIRRRRIPRNTEALSSGFQKTNISTSLPIRSQPNSYESSKLDPRGYQQEVSRTQFPARGSDSGDYEIRSGNTKGPSYSTYPQVTSGQQHGRSRQDSDTPSSRNDRPTTYAYASQPKDNQTLRSAGGLPQSDQYRPLTTPSANPRTSASQLRSSVQDDDDDDTPVQFSVLEGIEERFAMVTPQSFENCADFIEDNVKILYRSPGNFLSEAIKFASAGNNEWARRCLKCCLIIRTCNRESKPEKAHKLVLRFGRNTDEAETFREEMRILENSVIKQKSAIPTAAVSTRTRPGDISDTAKDTRKTSTTGQVRGSQNIARQSGQLRRVTQTSDTRPSVLPDDTETLTGISAISDSAAIRADQEVELPDENPRDSSRNSQVIRLLNQSYKRRVGHWFTPGKVFALLWHENATNDKSKQMKVSDTLDAPILERNIVRGAYQEPVYSHIRRMVVIRNRQGYCWCVPINTYGGRGLSKGGLSKKEKIAHAIIYDSEKQPRTVKNEDPPSKKEIAVDMADGQTLQAASRVNFAKPYSVEWNVKVMDVGHVSEESLAYLILYAKKELFDS